MKITVEFDTNNAAFEENPSLELREIMEHASHKAFRILSTSMDLNGTGEERLHDSNGNTVGTVKEEKSQ